MGCNWCMKIKYCRRTIFCKFFYLKKNNNIIYNIEKLCNFVWKVNSMQRIIFRI